VAPRSRLRRGVCTDLVSCDTRLVPTGTAARIAMNKFLARNLRDPRRIEIRRLWLLAVFLVCGSLGWRAVRDDIVRLVAQNSLGCHGRENLVLAVLRRNGLVGLDDDVWVSCYGLPRPGWMAWTWAHYQPKTNQIDRVFFSLADAQFRFQGTIAYNSWIRQPPIDAEGDGSWELLVKVELPWESSMNGEYWGVVRLKKTCNELLWLGYFDSDVRMRTRTRVSPVWRDSDDGALELVVIAETFRPTATRAFTAQPETVAVFKPGAAGGIFRQQSRQKGYGIIVWNAPHGKPARFGQFDELEPLFRALLPIPDAETGS